MPNITCIIQAINIPDGRTILYSYSDFQKVQSHSVNCFLNSCHHWLDPREPHMASLHLDMVSGWIKPFFFFLINNFPSLRPQFLTSVPWIGYRYGSPQSLCCWIPFSFGTRPQSPWGPSPEGSFSVGATVHMEEIKVLS